MENLNELLDKMKKLGMDETAAKAFVEALMSAEVAKEEAKLEAKVVEYRGPKTKREEIFYNAAEKVLDFTFGTVYGPAKEKCKPVIAATEKAVVKSRGWVGGWIKKIGEKIEPKS